MKLSTIGIEVADDFPLKPYEAVHSAIKAKSTDHPMFQHYADAWNAIGYRFQAAVEYGDLFIKSLDTYGPGPEPPERLRQERYLFGFFTSAVAAIDAAFYGLFSLGAYIDAAAFPLTKPEDEAKVNPRTTREQFTKKYPNDHLTKALNAVCSDEAFNTLRSVRNFLAHRAVPPRHFRLSVGDEVVPSAKWARLDLEIDKSIVIKGRDNLARLLGELLSAAEGFVSEKLAKV